uniref:Cyclic nucleotide-binding domain-containing protein n=1 Tax=Macrostomum lignano TaxID=282301 RepID=A0A1I8F8T0_9PLAT
TAPTRALATLRAGCYFGEISVLSLGRMGSRRTAFSALCGLLAAALPGPRRPLGGAGGPPGGPCAAGSHRDAAAQGDRAKDHWGGDEELDGPHSGVGGERTGTVDCLRQVAAKKD